MQSASATTFVEDWLCYDTILGEGAYGEVKLLIHKKTEEKVACKIINYDKYKDASSNVNREVMIHKLLDHENIIKFYGRRQEPLKEYIFLEYAPGGELFNMIEPDVGMPSNHAQKYFKELLNGLQYLHEKGIAHRDIKPENLLIDQHGVLKIIDFGLATLFRFKGKERLLDKKCGTKPYLAPEVLLRPYKATPADIWSSGIVLVAMLTGELPWSEPCDGNEEFDNWKNDKYLTESPWNKLGNTVLSLARQILNIDSKKRLTLQQILKHPWMKFEFPNIDTNCDQIDATGSRPAKRWNSLMESETRQTRETPNVVLSQPLPTTRPHSISQLVNEMKKKKDLTCFSQPAQAEDVIIQFTQSPVTKDNFHNLIKRMTRFYVTTSYEKTLEKLCSIFDSNHYTWTLDVSGSVTVSTVDYMKNQLIFKTSLFQMDGKILLDFRLSKGCGLEFKKKFLKIKQQLEKVVDISK